MNNVRINLGQQRLGAFILKAVVVLIALFIMNAVFSHSASASMATNSRLHNGNANSYCYQPANGPGWFALGMVWLSNEGDYYSETVNVGTNDNSVYVSVRGAVNACRTTWPGDRDIYAIDISTSYLSGMSGNQLYRGRMPASGNFAWTSEGSRLYGWLDVSGAAICNASHYSTGRAYQTIYVDIYRRQQQRDIWGGVTYNSPTGATETVPVNISRACPMYNFDLSPAISVSPDAAEAGANVNVAPTVNNTGATASTGVNWQVSQFRVPVGSAIPGGGTNGNNPAAHYGYGATVANPNGSGNQAFPTGNSPVGDGIRVLPATPNVGDRICYALSIQPVRHDNGSWRHSAPDCVVISKKPKVQVLGGDLIVGRASALNPATTSRVDTSITGIGSTYYGSWVEYSIVPSGAVFNMGSGSSYVGGAPSNDLCSNSYLTFSNATTGTCNASQIGNYTHNSTAPNVAQRFPTAGANPIGSGTATVNTMATGRHTTNATSLTVNASGSVPAGKWVAINAPNATVTITSDINYVTSDPAAPGSPLTSIGQIPQVVIIASNIIIADNVRNVDAWLVANGTGANGRVNTCGAGGVTETTVLHSGRCTNKLTVNGPVIANHLIMRRTAGAGPAAASGDPAEVFNLRADAYIWLNSYSLGSGRLPTISTTELPPRF